MYKRATKSIRYDHNAICIAEIKTWEYKVGLLNNSWCIHSRGEEYQPASSSQPIIMSTFDRWPVGWQIPHCCTKLST